MMDARQLDLLVSQGLEAHQNGNYPKALKKFEKALRMRPDDHAVREAAAYVANKAAAWESAATHWLAVSRQNAKRAGPVNQYISALLHAGRSDAARAYCETSDFMQADANRPRYYSVMITINLSDGRVKDAKKLAAKGFALSETDDTALAYAGLFLDGKHYSEVENWIARIRDREHHREAIEFLEARAGFAQKRWVKSTAAWEKVLAHSNKRHAASARLFLARIAVNTGNQKDAKKHYAQVLQEVPQHEEALVYFIRTRLANNDDVAARALIREHWEGLDPVRRVHLKARSYNATDPLAGMQTYLDELEKQPWNFALKLDYAGYLLDLKYIEQAEEKCLEYLQEQPESYDANRLYLRLMQLKPSPPDRQLKQARLTMALDPSKTALLNTVGGLLAQNNRRGDAVRHYRDAVKIAPDQAVLWRNGAYHMAMDNRLGEAAEFARRAVKTLGKTTAIQLTDAASIMMAAQQTGPASKYTNKAIKLAPDFADAHEMAVDLQMARGNYHRAWHHIRKVDALVFPRRSGKIAHLGAQCVAAFRAVSDDNSHKPVPVKGLFPEKLFDAIIKRAVPDNADDRQGIVQFSSSLGAGGAEWQATCVVQGIMDDPDMTGPCSLVVNSLNPQIGNDFFLPDVRETGSRIIDLDDLRQGASIRRILAEYPEHGDTIRQLASLPFDASRIAVPFFGYLVETRPRVVHLWQDTINIAAGIAAAAAGVPRIVLCTRSTRPAEISRYRRYLRGGYLALLNYRGALTIVNNSANGARDYEGWLDIPSGTIRTFYNGYDFKSIRAKTRAGDRSKIRAEYSIPGNAKVIGGVMRFSHEKRPDLWVKTLIAATAQSPDIHGLIVGDGPMRDPLIQEVEAAGLSDRIHFPGRQSPVEPWMAAMDLLFLSSVTEGLPNVLIEAQSLGVPVATMHVGGAPEALQPGKSGFTLRDATPAVLAQEMVAALQDSARMDAMSKAAVRFVNARFSLVTMVETLKNLYGPGG
jgi:glycosyltransferase involved in cell wall biosynthesis/tetratricopeptide (TPR) repeat protein